MEEETVTIKKSEYEDLLNEAKFMRCLESAGLDNWEGYDIAMDKFDSQKD